MTSIFCDGELINFLSYYFKIEIVYIGALVCHGPSNFQ